MGAQYGGGAALCVNGTFICFVLLLAKANIPHGEPWCPTSSKCSRLRHSGVTKRCSSWACIGNPNPEQETIEGTHSSACMSPFRRISWKQGHSATQQLISTILCALVDCNGSLHPSIYIQYGLRLSVTFAIHHGTNDISLGPSSRCYCI